MSSSFSETRGLQFVGLASRRVRRRASGGSLKVFVAQNASLTDVHWTMSGEIVLMTLVGGLGTVFGPVLGAFVTTTVQQ